MTGSWDLLFFFIGYFNSGSERVSDFIKCRRQLVGIWAGVLVFKDHNQGASGQHFFPALAKAKTLSIGGRHVELAFQVISVARWGKPGSFGEVVLIAKAKSSCSGMAIKVGGIEFFAAE